MRFNVPRCFKTISSTPHTLHGSTAQKPVKQKDPSSKCKLCCLQRASGEEMRRSLHLRCGGQGLFSSTFRSTGACWSLFTSNCDLVLKRNLHSPPSSTYDPVVEAAKNVQDSELYTPEMLEAEKKRNSPDLLLPGQKGYNKYVDRWTDPNNPPWKVRVITKN